MKNHTLLAAIILAGALTPLAGAQDMSDAERLARDYMVFYSAADWDGMEAFLADDVIFADPTALGEGVGPDGLYHEGREATMTALHEFGETYHPIELGFEWDTVFESNGRVVFAGYVNARYPTEDPARHFRWRAEQVTVITVREGAIVRQDDFANYAAPETGLVPAR